MLRFLIKFLLFAIVAIVATMLVAQWKLEKELDQLTSQARPFVDISYESAKISYTGEIKVNSINAYVNLMGTFVEIGEVRFSIGNLYELALFELGFRKRELPDSAYIVVEDLLVPFNSKLVKAFETYSQDSGMDVLQTAYCGNTDKFDISAFEAMGFDYLALDSEVYYMLDKYSGSAVLNGSMDMEGAFKIDYQINIGSVLSWLESNKNRAIGQAPNEKIVPDLALLEIRQLDKGFNSRKAEFCAQRQGVSVEEYYSGHTEAFKQLINEVDIQINPEFLALYTESLKPESEVYWFIQPKANFDMGGIFYYDYEELVELSGFQMSINRKPVEKILEGWSYQKYSDILARELVRKRQREMPNQRQYETVVIKREYRVQPLQNAGNFIDFDVRVTRNDGTLYLGKLTKTNDKNLWVLRRSSEGEITFPIKRTDVKSFEARVQVATD